MSFKTQKQRVLEHLQSGRTITQLEASDYMRITDLAGRIRDLRKDGHDIVGERGNTQSSPRFTRYLLKTEAQSHQIPLGVI